MKLCFLTVSHKLPPWLDELTADYEKKLSYWLKVETRVLKPAPHSRDDQKVKRAQESQSLIDAVHGDDFVILCDERGKDLETKNFAKRLEQILGGGKKRLLIIVGGAYGVDIKLRERADLTLSLSPFVMTHHLALAVISEQVYRAMTLLKGVQYHNE